MPEFEVFFDKKLVQRMLIYLCPDDPSRWGRKITIGRHDCNDIPIDQDFGGVSQVHAVIRMTSVPWIIDSGSPHNIGTRTRVNNWGIDDYVPLKDEDVIHIGKYRIIYHAKAREWNYKDLSNEGIRITSAQKVRLVAIKYCADREYEISGAVTDLGYNKADILIDSFLDVRASLIWNFDTGTCTLSKMSRLGTVKINGQSVKYSQAASLNNGDIIKVGRSVFRVEIH